MSKSFLGKRVAITGAAGSIGSALAQRVARLRPKALLVLDQNETGIFNVYEAIRTKCNAYFAIVNIRESERIHEVFEAFRPHIVYHVAALKHVELTELQPREAYKTNVLGLKNVVRASRGVEKLIFVSSDKAVRPTSVMGKTKMVGEKIWLKAHGIVVRFGNVIASQGSVVPTFQRRIAENKNLLVRGRKVKRYFMGIYEAVELILEATRIGNGGEIFVMDMGEQILIDDLAKFMIKLSGKDLQVVYGKLGGGEKQSELLMTLEEKKRATKLGKLWVIR